MRSDPPSRLAAASEDELVRDNPKGRLWEACAKRRIPPPQIRHAAVGPRHRVQMHLVLEDWDIETGVLWASSRRLAEQLAARALLVELADLERDEPSARPTPVRAEPDLGDDVFDVDADGTRLRQSNPTGQVYEWCQQQKPAVRRPRFEERKVKGGGFVVRGHLDTLDLHSPWFRAPRRKEAERAAAEALLHLLPVADDNELVVHGPIDACAAGEEATDLDAIATANPRTVLNELVMHGQLAECQVEVIDRSGSAHAPVFTAQGRARFVDGRSVQGEQVEGASKRAAITGAARVLLALVESAAG